MSCQYKELLASYVPDNSLHLLLPLLTDTSLEIKLTGNRKRALGQFRVKNNTNKKPQISVTKNLNKYYFLVILIHELAHYFTWKKYNNKRLLPHGMQWRHEHVVLMQIFINKDIFPQEIEIHLKNYMASGFTSKQARLHLTIALQKYNHDVGLDKKNKTAIGLFEVEELFEYAGEIYKVKKINRTRTLAQRISKDNKMFSFYKALNVDKI